MRATRGWRLLAFGLLTVWLGCGQRSEDRAPPSASEREGRSDVLRGLMASRERPPESSAPGSGALPMGAVGTGQGGSGRPAPTDQLHGRVEWVGDNELLIRGNDGVEYDVGVDDQTRLYMKGEPVTGLREYHEGDEVRVTYGDGPGGLVAHVVDGMPGPGAEPPHPQESAPREDPAGPGSPLDSHR